MEEQEKIEFFKKIVDEDEEKEGSRRELRKIELKAYSTFLDAVRADGTLDKEKRGIIDTMRKYLNISDARHSAECRRVASDGTLCSIADRLQENPLDEPDDTWNIEAGGTFPPLPKFHHSVKRSLVEGTSSAWDIPFFDDSDKSVIELLTQNTSILAENIDVESVTEEDLELATISWNTTVEKVNKKVQTKESSLIKTIKKEQVSSGGSSEVEEVSEDEEGKEDRARSPDIVDITSPVKTIKTLSRTRSIVVKTEPRPPLKEESKRPSSLNKKRPVSAMMKIRPRPGIKIGTKAKHNFKKSASAISKAKGKLPKIKFVKRRPLTPQSTNEEDDGKPEEEEIDYQSEEKRPIAKKLFPSPGCNSSRDASPNKETANSLQLKGRTVLHNRNRSGGSRGESSKVISLSSSSPERNVKVKKDESSSPVRNSEKSVTPIKMVPVATSSSCPSSSSAASTPATTARSQKVAKPRRPLSLSRRKSRLKEKEDDDMQVGWNDDDDSDPSIISNRRVPIKKRKLLHASSSDWTATADFEKDDSDSNHQIDGVRGEFFENGEGHRASPMRQHQQHPQMHNYVDAADSYRNRSPSISEEDTDSASEKGSFTGRTLDSPSNNSNTTSPPPVRQKQRLKSPLAPSQMPRINIPPPVFSTSLSSVQKKRPEKHISVVDSLNLHLPTTPTASSLASRRPSLGGSNIFSNSQAIIARASGGSNILQQQRKPLPHILSTAKVLQRSFVPVSASISSNNPVTPGGASAIATGINISTPSINSVVNISPSSNTTTPVHINSAVSNNVLSTSTSPPSGSIIQLPGTPSNSLSTSSAATVPVAAAAGQGSIIFLQKTPPNVTNSPGLQNSNLNPKPPSRAVILRRTPLPRPGNVVILDVQNQSSPATTTPSVSSFLHQIPRIVTAPSPSEISFVNQEGRTQRTVGASASLSSSPASFSHAQIKPKVDANHISVPTIANATISSFSTPSLGGNVQYQCPSDATLAQGEQGLLQMDQDVVYEEEVVTSVDDSDSSTNGQHSFEIPISNFHITIPPESPTGGSNSKTENHTSYRNSSSTPQQQEDIFQAALKSSGIVFDQEFYELEVTSEDSQQYSGQVANHVEIDNAESGSH